MQCSRVQTLRRPIGGGDHPASIIAMHPAARLPNMRASQPAAFSAPSVPACLPAAALLQRAIGETDVAF